MILSVLHRYLFDDDDVRAAYVDDLKCIYRGGLSSLKGRALLSTWLVVVARSTAPVESYPGGPGFQGELLYYLGRNVWEWCNESHNCAPENPGRAGPLTTGAAAPPVNEEDE